MNMIYEGKAKQIFETDNKDEFLVHYKDDATAFNGEKKGTIEDKGVFNNKISAFFFELLEKEGIPTHFIKRINDRNQIVKSLEIIPLEVVVRNIMAGSLAKRLGKPEGLPCSMPIVELYYKDDALGDPMINHFHVKAMGIATDEQIAQLEEYGLRINEILKKFLAEKKVTLVDFKLEFGLHKGQIILGDEISPDTCRFWDSETQEKLDKDRFRRDMGNVEDAYKEMLFRLTGERL